MTAFIVHGDEIEKGRSLALGNFDGVHLGHQAVLHLAKSKGDLSAVSFRPHPRRFFDPDAERFELMNDASLERVLRQEGAVSVHQIAFSEDLSLMDARLFFDALCAHFEPCAISTGPDFRFGKGREGGVEELQKWGQAQGVCVQTAQQVEWGGARVSSTRIRHALGAGKPSEAAALLGRPHIMNQIVTQGDQRGRDLGFPTANLYPKSVMLPKFGIYATRVHIHGGEFAGDYFGASSLGVRPSFGVNQPNFETYILDFEGDIYGAEMSVELISYIRPELKFDDIDALIAQMHDDVARCRAILKGASDA